MSVSADVSILDYFEYKGLGTRFELEFEKGIREYIEKSLYGGTGYF